MVQQTEPTFEGAEVTVAEPPAREPTPALTRGAAVGRYTVLGEVGRGAMGVVYAAYDPELDRRIALKVLHATQGEEGAQRLIREARALARFSHRNVVTVHDVGVVSGRGFIATEFIEGQTLSDWLGAETRSTEAILDALQAAGRGLAAAHEAGLVHRDFKPHNVMVTAQGRVVVMDFGLARHTGETGEPQSVDTALSDPIEVDHSPGPPIDLTSTGMVMGTPAYMSLEQHCGQPVTALSDQYSFCVTAFEALCDERPFVGPTRLAIAKAIKKGQRASWSNARSVPSQVRRALERGLQASAEDRWPSMHALLEALQPAPKRTANPWLVAAGGLGIAVSGVVGFTLASDPPDSACAGVDAPLEAVWGQPQAERLGSVFASTRLPYATETTRRVTEHLDAYADRWRAGRSDACVAHHVEKLQSATVHDARTRCLARGLLELKALVGVLTQGEVGTVRRATDAVLQLPDLSRCADVEALLDRTPRPTDDRAAQAIDEARAALVEARVHRLTGDLAEAERNIARAEQRAEIDEPYLPLAAELALARGLLLRDQSRFPEAAQSLEHAHLDARRSGHRDIALQSAMQLIFLTGYRLARYDTAELWSRIAQAEADRAGTKTADHAQILSWTGILYGRRGNYERARTFYLDAKQLYESLGVENHAGYDAVFTNLGLVSTNLDDAEAAEQYLLEARRRSETRYGRTHPRMINAILNLSTAALGRGHVPEAQARAEEAVRLAEEALPSKHVTVAHALEAAARAALAAGRLDRASQAMEQATPVLEATLGADHPAYAESLARRSELRKLRGNLPEAIADAQLARAKLQQRFGIEDARTAEATAVLAMARHAAGEFDTARTLADEVLDVLPAGAPKSAVPRARAHLVLADLEAESDPESSERHRTEARAALHSSGALGAHLLER